MLNKAAFKREHSLKISVVCNRSSVKMIRLYTVMAVATTLSAVLGSPLHSSSVYMRRGPPPVEYVSYEVPVAAAAAGYNVGPTLYTNYQPCVAPCVMEAPAAPPPAGKSEIVEAKSADPNLVILPGNAPSSSYDYGYVIYNEAGGQQQPVPAEGIVSTQFDYRPYYGPEIVYTNDILNGYNTYFRNYVPQTQGGVGVKAQRGHEGYYVAQPGVAIAHSGGASTTLTPTTSPSEKPETKEEEPKTETEEPKQEVEKVKTLEEMEAKEEKEPELLEDSAEMSTEEAPGGDDDLKYILTFEDLIKCSQAAVEGNRQHNHKGHNHNKPSADEDKNPEHSGHESGSESPKENKENSEGALAPGSSAKTSEIEEHEAVTQSPTIKEMTPVEEKPKHHKKLPVTYIILPQIAATKPC